VKQMCFLPCRYFISSSVLFVRMSVVFRAMRRFQAMDAKAADTAVETTLLSYHQNTVT